MVKDFDKYDLGDVVGDMHEWGELMSRFTLVSHVKWSETGRYGFGSYIEHYTPQTRRYTNKLLVVIGWDDAAHLICAYSYDNRTAGIVVLAKKGAVS